MHLFFSILKEYLLLFFSLTIKAIDSPSKSLMTPLHVLVKTYVTDLEKFKSTFDVLIQCQADINAKDESQL